MIHRAALCVAFRRCGPAAGLAAGDSPVPSAAETGAMPSSATFWILIGLGVLFVLLVLFVVRIYNRLVSLRNRYENGFSQIDVQLKRRYDLIPNLVETAKGYMKHERETLEAVIAARNQAVTAEKAASRSPGDPQAIRNLAGAEGALSGALSRLFAVAEAYPDLKANQNMLSLQEELTSTENKVAFARQAYNDAVTTYNTQREVVPDVFVANMFNFREAMLFELESPAERDAPRVSF
jgi:LemA protein